ncbi:MAG: hypothetical protein IPM29_18480 [Planctomycetes bacterium]|nr:hypothetical protein [Planctomycetota bacterium]
MRRVYLLYCLSGLLSLGYQVAWFRVFVDAFGSTNLTFAFVVANFIGGLAAGSLASRRFAGWLGRRARVADPLRLYGVVELGVALTAALTLLLPALPADLWDGFPYALDGRVFEPTAAATLAQLLASTACVFAPCFLMGVTFPLLCDVFRSSARFPAALYAWNTLGACGGVIAAEFLLLAWLGHQRMFLTIVIANALLGGYFAAGRVRLPAGQPRPAADQAATALPATSTLVAIAVLGGGLTGAFEADVLRRLQFLDCRTGAALSCISLWAILAIFLASATVRLAPRLTLRHLQIGVVLALGYYLAVWHDAYALKQWANSADDLRVRAALPRLPAGLTGSFLFVDFGYGFRALLLFTGVFVLPPFYLLSLLLPFACNRAQADGRHLGTLYGANTLAFCVGIVAFSTLAPGVNLFYALRLFLAMFALGALGLFALRIGGRPARAARTIAGAWLAALVALVLLTPASFAASWFAPSSPASRLPVRALRSDGAHTTFVLDDRHGDWLFFDSHAMSGTNPTAQRYMRLMAHVPLLAHPRPAGALLICFGVGNTASAIAAHRSIERLDVVDLNRQVFATAPEFADTNHGVIDDPRIRLIHDDGRHYLAVSDASYDLVTSEPPPPMFPGVSRLYSVEYYESVRAHLTPGGFMTQWLPIEQMPRPAMRSAIASFIAVFPQSLLFVGADTNFILLGCNGALDLQTIERRYAESPAVAAELTALGVPRPAALLARITMGPRALAAEFGGEPLVSDQRNDFSHVFHDPGAPANLTYDPSALLAELPGTDERGLRCADELRRITMHLGRLKTAVPDFPATVLQSVPRSAGMPGAGVDWVVVGLRIAAAAERLRGGDLASAVEQLREVLRLSPELPLVQRDLGTMLLQLGRDAEAADVWRALQAVEPDDVAGVYGEAFALHRTGADERALAVLRAHGGRFPGSLALARLAGDILAARQRWAEALAHYDRALAIEPRDQLAAAGRERCIVELRR